MMGMNRRNTMVAGVMLSLCSAMAGCLNSSNNPSTARGANPDGFQNQPGVIRQTSFMQPMQPMHPMQPMQTMPPEEGGDPQVLGMPTMVADGHGMMPMMAINPPLPTELAPSAHAPHRVAAPDILLIEALRLVPRGPYKLEPMEFLQIEATDSLPGQPIKGVFIVSPEGRINLGYSYAPIMVGGLTIEAAQEAIRAYLATIIAGFRNRTAAVSVNLVQMRGMQNVRGEHLVRPDGTIHLGMYGSVFVAGMTVGQVKCVIEKHLSAYLIDPQVSVDVKAYNSRKIYIIADGAGLGQHVIALPATGNETVLDAISRLQGGNKQIPEWCSTKKIWVARPSPSGAPCSTVLPVDWRAITEAGRTETNYQLFPGDRIYISGDPCITAYNYIDKFLAPIQRVLDFALIGATTVQAFRNNGNTSLLVAR
jgi:protein involved in polysaccharide export with SLBB domain